MDFLPKIYTIQASDAPQHTERLRTILQEMQTEERIGGFTVLTPVEDLSTLAGSVNDEDMILIVLTDSLEPQRAMVERKVRDLSRKVPGLRVAEILLDNIVYDNDFITFPDDLRPIRNREDMDEAWNNIARSLRDIFPVKEKKKAKPFPLWILLGVLGVFLFGVLLVFIWSTAGAEETEETFTTVPDLTGMSGTEAVSLLLDAGLEAGERRVESHDTVNRDLVIRSEPNAGESIEKGAQVTLIFSSGREQVRVPELTGVTLDRARAALEGTGLRVGHEQSESNNQFEQGRVIRSDPGAGREIDRGSQINLVISSGPSTTPTPPVGITEADLVLQPVPSIIHLLLPAPSQVSPDNEAVVGSGTISPFGVIRTTNVSWSAVNGAARYGLEWVALSPGQACRQINDSHNLQKQEDIQGTSFPIRHARNTAICWRVYAVSSNDIIGRRSDWRQFRSN